MATGVGVVAILEVPLLVVVLVDVLARLTVALSALLLFLLLLKLPLGLDALVLVESMSDALFLARGLLLLVVELNLLRRHLNLLLVLSMRV